MPLRSDELEEVRRIVREEIALALKAKAAPAAAVKPVEVKPAVEEKSEHKLGGKK